MGKGGGPSPDGTLETPGHLGSTQSSPALRPPLSLPRPPAALLSHTAHTSLCLGVTPSLTTWNPRGAWESPGQCGGWPAALCPCLRAEAATAVGSALWPPGGFGQWAAPAEVNRQVSSGTLPAPCLGPPRSPAPAGLPRPRRPRTGDPPASPAGPPASLAGFRSGLSGPAPCQEPARPGACAPHPAAARASEPGRTQAAASALRSPDGPRRARKDPAGATRRPSFLLPVSPVLPTDWGSHE